MIFGNAEFMGMPFEPIIKGFRASVHAKPRDTLIEYADAFFVFLEKEVHIEDDMRRVHIYNIFESVFQDLFRVSIDKLFKQKRKSTERLADTLAKIVTDEVEQKISEVEAKEDCYTLAGVTADDLSQIARNEVESSLKNFVSINPPSDDLFAKLLNACGKLIGLYLKKDVFSEQSTGIAFSGFGTKENFPSLIVFDTEGLINQVVKRKVVKTEIISPLKDKGHIVELSQDDIVKRYVEGVDPKLCTRIEKSLERMVGGLGEALAENWFRGAKKASAIAHARNAAKEAVNSFVEDIINKSKDEERKAITEAVHHMSKAELAQLAEALVEMTALRRRVSMDVETVGGPIDVAVISRGDGFVWIKRKHYFKPELNPRYAALQQATMKEAVGHEE